MVARNQSRVEISSGERLVHDDAFQQCNVGRDTHDLIPAQGVRKALSRPVAVFTPRNDFRDHGIVVLRDLVARAHASVDTQARRFRRCRKMRDATDRGKKAALGILGIDACLHCVSPEGELILRHDKRLARGHAQLPLDKILPGDHLRHRMLDL